MKTKTYFGVSLVVFALILGSVPSDACAQRGGRGGGGGGAARGGGGGASGGARSGGGMSGGFRSGGGMSGPSGGGFSGGAVGGSPRISGGAPGNAIGGGTFGGSGQRIGGSQLGTNAPRSTTNLPNNLNSGNRALGSSVLSNSAASSSFMDRHGLQNFSQSNPANKSNLSQQITNFQNNRTSQTNLSQRFTGVNNSFNNNDINVTKNVQNNGQNWYANNSTFFGQNSPYGNYAYYHGNYYPYGGYGAAFALGLVSSAWLGYGSGYGYSYGYPYYAYQPVFYYSDYDNGGYASYDSYYVYSPEAAPITNPGTADPNARQLPGDQTAAMNATGFAAQGETDFKAGRYDSAIRSWRHALVDDPGNPAIMMLLGQALFATGKFEEAAGATQQAMRLLPDDKWGIVVSNYKELYPNIQAYTDQLRALEAARTSKDNPALRFLLGYHYAYLNFPKNALAELDKCVEGAPKDEIAKKLRDAVAAKLTPTAAVLPAPESNP